MEREQAFVLRAISLRRTKVCLRQTIESSEGTLEGQPKAVLDHVAQPTQIRGRVTQIRNTLLLEMESSAIAFRSLRHPLEQGR